MNLPRLLLVSDRKREQPGALASAVAAGAPLIQLRDKDLDDAAVMQRLIEIGLLHAAADGSSGRCGRRLETAASSRAAAAASEPLPASALPRCCLNGRPELARRLRFGLHLPASHAPVPRQGLSLMGRSAHDGEEVRRARSEGVDYLVIGTVFPTASKPGREALGLTGLAQLVALAAPLPVFAIGGMTVARTREVLATGAHGVAVCTAILAAADPAAATLSFLEELSA